MDSLRNCVGVPSQQAKPHVPRECIFCDVSKERGFNVVCDTTRFTVFADRSPGAKMHLLCVPKRHIANVKALTSEDVPMLTEMASIGRSLLDEAGFADVQQRLGFHIPPFYSVDHLHLHILGLPFTGFWSRWKYRPNFSQSHGKGLSHFVEVGQAVEILRAGGKIGVRPC